MMKIIKNFYHLVVDNKLPTLAGALCFFILINGGAFFFLFVNLFSYYLNDIKSVIITNTSNDMIRDLLIYLIEHNANLPYSLFLIITSIYSSSTLYYHILNVSELITKKPISVRLSKRIISLILVPIILIILYIILLVLSVLYTLFKVVTIVLIFILLLLLIIFFNIMVLRDYRVKIMIKGIIFSLLYIIVFTLLFIAYLSIFSNFKIVYGILSFFIIFLFYIYNVVIGLLIGAFINWKNIEVFNIDIFK